MHWLIRDITVRYYVPSMRCAVCLIQVLKKDLNTATGDGSPKTAAIVSIVCYVVASSRRIDCVELDGGLIVYLSSTTSKAKAVAIRVWARKL